MSGYSLPYRVVATVQSIVLMAIFFVALGMIFGATFTVAQTSGAYALVLMLTIFGGAWFDLEEIGGVFVTIGDLLPFKHALAATRAVMADGARFASIATDVYWVGGYTVAAVVLAVAVFQRRMLE